MDQRQKEKKEKIRKPLSAGLILAGLFFFLNPNVGLIDVLPDFIGAVLVIAGFLQFADIDERARSAQKALIILAFTDAGKTLALLLLRQSEGTVWTMIFTFVFGIAEAGLFSYALCKLFAGILYRAARHDCARLLRGFSALYGLTVLIGVLKGLLSILPELTALSTDYGDVVEGAASSAQVSHFIYTALTIFNVAVVTIYGIGWWIYQLRFFRTLAREEEFLESLSAQYDEEVGSKPSVLTYRALKTAGVLVAAAVVFLLPLYLDGTDHLPDYLAGILFILACLRLRKLYPAPARRAMIAGGVYTLFAAAEWIAELLFRVSIVVDYDAGYYLSARTVINRYPARASAYFSIIGVGVAKYLALAVFLFFFLALFKPIIAEHTGVAFETSSAHSAEKDRRIKQKLYSFLYVLTGLAAAAAAAGILRRVLRMFSDYMLVEYSELIGVLPFAVLLVVFLFKLQDGIDNKYYLEK